MRLLSTDPDIRFEDILAGAARAAVAQSPAQDQTDVMRILRRMKAEAALLIALADTGGVWQVIRVPAALTKLADAAVGLGLVHLVDVAAPPGCSIENPQRPEQGSGYTVLAMGRWSPQSSTTRATST
jgi:glutamate-ammonia-ligase adenylyltransferase